MNPVQMLEIVVALSVQTALLVGLTVWLVRRNISCGSFTEQLWTCCLLAVCVIIPAVAALPSLRLLPAGWLDSVLTATSTAEFSRFAWGAIAIWATGAGLSLLNLIAGWCRTARFLGRHTRPPDTGEITASGVSDIWNTETAATPTQGSQSPELRVSRSLAGPFCWQFHRPIVVLPESVLDFPNGELALILRHELIHLSRQHPLQLFLQRLLEVAFWFHPLVHYLSHQLDRSRELVCDQLAIHDAAEAQAYLTSLLRLAEGRVHEASPRHGALEFFQARKSWIQDRVTAIAAGQWERRTAAGARSRQLLIVVTALAVFPVLRLPTEMETSRTELWSPWPQWSADALHSLGINVRDYEPDWFRTPQHEHHSPVMPEDYAPAEDSPPPDRTPGEAPPQ